MFSNISFAYSETVTGSDVSASMSITSSSVDFSAYKIIQTHAFRWIKCKGHKDICFIIVIMIIWYQNMISCGFHLANKNINTLTGSSTASSVCCCLVSSLLLLSASELQLKSSHIRTFHHVDDQNVAIIECTLVCFQDLYKKRHIGDLLSESGSF